MNEFSHLSFAKARTKFRKLNETLKKDNDSIRHRWETITAAAKGFDYVIYTAITGPNCKNYNGSRGEDGIEANEEVGKAVCEAFVSVAKDMNDEELNTAIKDIISKCTKCEPYGFYNYDCYLKDGVEAAKAEFDLLSKDHQKKIEDSMAVPKW